MEGLDSYDRGGGDHWVAGPDHPAVGRPERPEGGAETDGKETGSDGQSPGVAGQSCGAGQGTSVSGRTLKTRVGSSRDNADDSMHVEANANVNVNRLTLPRDPISIITGVILALSI